MSEIELSDQDLKIELMNLRQRVAELEAEKKSQLPADQFLRPGGEEVLPLLAQIFDVASQPFAVTNHEDRIVLCNKAFCKLTGRSEQELRDQGTFWDITPPEWHGFEKELLSELQRTHSPVRYQKEYRRPDGSLLPIELFVSCYTNCAGETLYFGLIHDLSEQRRIEEELRKANSQLRAIFQAMPDLYFLLDENGVILDFHSIKEGNLYTAPVNFLGKRMQDVMPADIGRQFDEAARELRTGKPMAVIEYMLPMHGKEEHYEARLIPLAMNQIFVIVRNITERVEIRKKEEKFRLLYDEAPNGYQTLDGEGKIIDVNKIWQAMSGYDKDEVIGRWFGELLSPEQAPLLKDTLLELREKGEVHGCEFQMRCRDHAMMTISMEGRAYYDENGIFRQAHCTIRDITSHKRVEDRLHKLFQAVTQSPSTVVITDLSGNIEYANPKFSQLTGYSLEEVIGKNSRFLKSGEMDAANYKLLWNTIQAGNDWCGEFHNRKKNGELYWERATISPIRNAEGVVTNYLKVGEDITENRRTLDELRAAESMFRTLVEQSLAGIYIMQDNRWKYVNPRFAEILGYSPEEIINTKELHDIVAAEDHALLDENIRKRSDCPAKS